MKRELIRLSVTVIDTRRSLGYLETDLGLNKMRAVEPFRPAKKRQRKRMRTIFDDVEARNNLEEEKKGGSRSVPILLWFVALTFVVATFGIYRWVIDKPAPEPPPPPVSLEDIRQTAAAFSKFNRYVQDDNWVEAEKLISITASQTLVNQQKTLKQSVLGDRENDRVVEAASTPSGERMPNYVSQDCVYKFSDGQFKIIPLVLVLENGRLVINSWSEPETKEEDKKRP